MFLKVNGRRSRLLLGVGCCGFLAVSAAWGQSQVMLSELKKLDERVARPDQVLPAAEAKRASDRLAEWRLKADALSPEDRGRLWRVELYVALARGDAAKARDLAGSLLAEFPDDRAMQQAGYLAACAAGDAKLGMDMLKRLSADAHGEERRALSRRRRWMRGVGERAPDLVIRTEDMTEYSTTRRGERVLLINFWKTLPPPDEETMKALCGLFDEYRHSLHIDFVGVNADAESRVPEAREFADKHGYAWKQRYEAQATGAPITHQAFHAGSPPWHVLIDTFGYVRAVGSAAEPGFHYAVRAAVAEAAGDYEIVMPTTREGEQPQRPSKAIEVEPKSKERSQPEGERPSNPEALSKLRLARTYLKTGKRTDAKRLFEEIVRDYPGTQEAKEAQEYLDSIWGPP